jgi:NADH-quinone oxidoreductase subunit G
MALEAAANALKETDPQEIGALCSPSATLEELYLAQKLIRGLGSNNIDCRLRQGDFRLDGLGPAVPWLGMPIGDLETLDAALLIGSNVRKEQPLLAHRLRKAALQGGGICFINPLESDFNFPALQHSCSPEGMLQELAAVAKALGVKGKGETAQLLRKASKSETAQATAESLKQGSHSAVLLGSLATAHPDYALLVQLATLIAEASDAKLGFMPLAANMTGAALAGAMPHLSPRAMGTDQFGANALEQLQQPRKTYLLMGVEPGSDFWNPSLAHQAMQSAETVIAVTSYRCESLDFCADIQLPVAGFAETSGVYVNAEGTWQQFRGAVRPLGESRPAWKVLRVLGNLLGLEDFDYIESRQVSDELAEICQGFEYDNSMQALSDVNVNSKVDGICRIGDVPLYATDPLVRRAVSLQRTHDAGSAALRLNQKEIRKQGLDGAESALVKQNGSEVNLPIETDHRVPDGCVWISAGVAGSEALGQQFGEVTLEKA